MKKFFTTMNGFRATIPACLILLATGAGVLPMAATPQASPEAEMQQKRLELMKSKGPDVTLTILPVRLAGQSWDRVTEVVGLLLEQQGLKHIELGKKPFSPPATNLNGMAAAVGTFVKSNAITNNYALYAEFNGDRQTGLNEMRAVVVDAAGATVWTDRLTAEDDAFKKAGNTEPLTLAVLMVERLKPQLGLDAATARAAKPGNMAAIMDERSGLPPADERSAMPELQQAMKKAMPGATVLVYPPRIDGANPSVVSGSNVVRSLNQAGLCKAVQAEEPVLLKASLADPNELKALWGIATEFRDYVRAHPPAADYALYADYFFNPQHADQGFVHWVICDRKGDLVVVDMQNSHNRDYQTIGITSRDRCDQLLLRRLEGYLR
jgi:hypothetical protein